MKIFSYSILKVLVVYLVLPITGFSQWVQQGNKLVPDNPTGFTIYHGYSVALSADGNTAIVGGIGNNANAGAAWIYVRSGSVWTQQAKLIGTGAVGNASQGFSVAISNDGNTAAIGGLGDNTFKGAVWVFSRSGGTWSQMGSKLVGTGFTGNSQQGSSVAISGDGNTIITGGFQDNANNGAAWIFTRSGSTWNQQGSKLVVTDAIGVARFGISVDISLDGNTAIIGGHTDNANAGAAWIFTRSGTTWTARRKLTGAGAIGNARFGRSVSVSSNGTTAIVGGYEDNASAGAVWVFTGSGSSWNQEGDKLVGTGATGNASQGFSISLSASGNTALIGGIDDNAFAGATWVFKRVSGTWSQSGGKLVGSGATGNANQGGAVAISPDGNTLISGGIADDANMGAAWIFIPGSTSIKQTSGEIPNGYLLEQNYPNPFNPVTKISWQSSNSGNQSLKIYDMLGNEVALLVDEYLSAGSYEFSFDASNLSSGIYFYTLRVGNFSQTKKMTLLK